MAERKKSKSRRSVKVRTGQIKVAPGKPFELVEDSAASNGLKRQSSRTRPIGEMIKAYIEEGHELLAGRYAAVKEFAPPHLARPCRVLVVCCTNGVIVRYDRSDDEEDHLFVGSIEETAEEFAKLISEHVIYCVPEGTAPESIDTSSSPKIALSTVDATTREERKFVEFRVFFLCPFPKTGADPQTPRSKPFRLIGVGNNVDLEILGEEISLDKPDAPGRRFLASSSFRLKVGWEYVEVFPDVDEERWDVAFASSWAQGDILDRVMRHQLRQQGLRALDPNVDARKGWARLFQAYEELLASDPEEEALQRFLTENPIMLSPTHMRVWPKVAFGDKVSDFVFREANGDYLLVELERPSKPLFIKRGDTSSQLNHAQNQISDWKRYIADNLRTVQDELGLKGISTNAKSLIVIGRSATVLETGRRKLVTMRSDNPAQNIMTYDDVLNNARAAIENILGPLWATSGAAEVYFLREPVPGGDVT